MGKLTKKTRQVSTKTAWSEFHYGVGVLVGVSVEVGLGVKVSVGVKVVVGVNVAVDVSVMLGVNVKVGGRVFVAVGAVPWRTMCGLSQMA